MTILYLIRHGETVDNYNKIMQGQTQGELNEKGIEQAHAVSRNLAGEQFDAIRIEFTLCLSLHYLIGIIYRFSVPY